MRKNVCINKKGKRNVVKRNHKKKTSDNSVFHRIDVFTNDVFCCHLLLNIYDDRTDIKMLAKCIFSLLIHMMYAKMLYYANWTFKRILMVLLKLYN